MGTGIVQYWYWEFFIFSGGIGTGIENIWYRKKVSETVLEKFGTGTDFCRQNLRILKICNGYNGNFSGGIGTGTEKVPVSVSKIFGTGKKYWYRYRLTFWVPSHTAIKAL